MKREDIVTLTYKDMYEQIKTALLEWKCAIEEQQKSYSVLSEEYQRHLGAITTCKNVLDLMNEYQELLEQTYKLADVIIGATND